MDKEFAQLTTLATDMKEEMHGQRKFVTGRNAHNEVVMQQCGIGKVIKGNTAYGCSRWKEGCDWRKPFK